MKILIRKKIDAPNVHNSPVCNSQDLEATKCPKTDEWIKKIWYRYKMEYYSAIKMNEILLFATMWMDLEIIILTEVRKRKTNGI